MPWPKGRPHPREGIPETILDGVDVRKLFYHRVASKHGCDFKLTRADFSKFLDVMGPIPEGMKSPTVGRLDHSKGYVYDHERKRWNFEWQSRADNNREGSLRLWREGNHPLGNWMKRKYDGFLE